MGNLALFDFDGTITTSDTFTPFIRFAVSPRRMAVGKIALSPLIIGYKLGAVHASPVRASIVRVGLSGRNAADIFNLGATYARDQFPNVIRPGAIKRIQWHKSRGDTVAIVSASLNVYLSDWCNQLGLELICTELEVKNGFLTGRYHHGDCTGDEKARRILKRFDLNSFSAIYAYGDTNEDEAMLSLGTKKFFRWQETSDLRQTATAIVTAGIDPGKAERLKEIDQENLWLERLISSQEMGSE